MFWPVDSLIKKVERSEARDGWEVSSVCTASATPKGMEALAGGGGEGDERRWLFLEDFSFLSFFCFFNFLDFFSFCEVATRRTVFVTL